jgi:PAS domain S-box-containing protein
MACTLAVVALMVAADAVFLWQMTRVQNEVRRLYLANQRSAATRRLHEKVLQFRERLERLALAQDAGQFEGEMASFTKALSADAEAAREAMRTSESSQAVPLLAMVESIQSVLPPQSAAVAALVEAGDWRAIRERLDNQLLALGLQTTSLADTVDAEAAQEWAEALRTTERVRREVLSVVPATALLTLFLAVWLGVVLTRSITRPLTDVGAAAHALAGGDFQHVIPVEGRDELSDLAVAFNSTAKQLRVLYQALKDNEARFRTIADDTPAYLWMTSEKEEGTFLNRAFRDFLGIGANTGGEVWSGRVHPEDADRVGAKLRAAPTQRRAYTDEFRIRRGDGEYRWVVNQGIPRISPTGGFLGYAGAVLDISERKRAEEDSTR